MLTYKGIIPVSSMQQESIIQILNLEKGSTDIVLVLWIDRLLEFMYWNQYRERKSRTSASVLWTLVPRDGICHHLTIYTLKN